MAWARKLTNPPRWQGVATHPSGRKSTKVFRLKGQAEGWAADVERGWAHGTVRDPRSGRLTLAQWYALWLPARTVADTTAEREQRIHKALVIPQWGTWPLETITRIEVRTWVARMLRGGESPAQIHLAFYALSAMLRDAANEDPPLILANPCARVPLPPLPTPSERFFTQEEFARILEVMRDPWRTMVALSSWSGLRWEELAGLHGPAVDWLRGTVHVATVRTRFGDRPYPKSDRSRRTVPVPGPVMESMSRLMVGRPRDARVFINRGEPCNYATWLWNFKRACATAGVEYAPPHTLRHTAASWLAQDGVDQFRIQAMLGHESARTTARYSHLEPAAHGRIREAWAKMESESRCILGASGSAGESG